MPNTYLLNHTSGKTAGTGLGVDNARAYGSGLVLGAGDTVKALATLPVDTGLSAEWESRRDKIRVADQNFWKPVFQCSLARRTGTWTRSGTTITAQKTDGSAHGLSTGDWICIPPNGTSDLLAMPFVPVANTYMYQVTVSGTTFTFTGANAGALSGTFEWVDKVSEPEKYFTWTKSGTTITCTSQNAHGQGASTNNVNIIQVSNNSSVIKAAIKSATFSSTNTFTFTDTNGAATSGAGFFETGLVGSANVSTIVDELGGMRNDGQRQYLATATAFTTGLVGYVKMKSTLDLSAYQMLSMQLYISIAYTGARIVLCSDSAGATPIAGCDWLLNAGTPVNGLARYMAMTFTPYGTATVWTASQAVTVGNKRYVPQHCTGHSGVYRCTGNGTCGAAEPIWNTDGSTIIDGTATWVFDGYVNLPNNVNSIAVYNNNDLAANNYLIECVAAFKAPTNATCLTYEHLILPTPNNAVQRNTLYTVGTVITPTPVFGSNMRYLCVVQGTTHNTTEPTWNHLIGSLTTDGNCVFKNIGFQEAPLLIREMHYTDDKTDITLHDGGAAAAYQTNASTKQWSNGYCNPLFPAVLSAQANVGDSYITVEDASVYMANRVIKISNIDEYIVDHTDLDLNRVYLTSTIVTQRAIGQVVRVHRKTANLWKIRPHYNARIILLALNGAIDSFNASGTESQPVTYQGGYDSTYTNIIGQTFIYSFNNTNMYGFYFTTNSGYRIIRNVGYVGIGYGFLSQGTTSPPKSLKLRNCYAIACNQAGVWLGGVQNGGQLLIMEYCTLGMYGTSFTTTTMTAQLGYFQGTPRGKGILVFGTRSTNASNLASIACCAALQTTSNFSSGGEAFFDEVYILNTTQAAGNVGLQGGCMPLFARNLKTDFCYSGGFTGNHVQHKLLNFIDRTGTPFLIPQICMGFAPWMMSDNHMGLGITRWEQYGATVLRDTSIVGYFWKCSITSTGFGSLSACRLPIPIRLKCTQGVSCSFSVKMRRDSTNIICGIRIEGAYNDFDADYEQLISVGAGTDEDVTLTFTPSRSGIFEPKIIVYATDALSSVYIGQITKIAG